MVTLAACGRLGFDEVSAGDGSSGDAPTDPCATVATRDWALWTMPNTRDVGLPHQPSYTVGVDTVTDNITGLTWERDVDPIPRTAALAHDFCASLILDGACDWRLPTRVELVSIVDYAVNTPAIDSTVFPSTPSAQFWSATPDVSGTGVSWFVNFADGLADSVLGSEQHLVRCVRGGIGAPDARYQVNAEDVLDNFTGLRWQRAVDAGTYNFADSAMLCANLQIAGGGWRMPSIGELQTLVETAVSGPSVDPVAFPSSPPDLFWTGSLRAFATTDGWTVNFIRGFGFRDTGIGLRARCVRDN
jgi:hypothetical protein